MDKIPSLLDANAGMHGPLAQTQCMSLLHNKMVVQLKENRLI